MRLFIPIAKVDAEARMVYGYASTEAQDDQGEIVTKTALDAALADYMKFANIREMHQLSAVGTAKQAAMDDKGLYVAANIIDEPAWEKVKAGVYKGFSIGGKVKERNPSDPSTITSLALNEISLVDRPANPEAVFDCWKASGDGAEAQADPPADPAPRTVDEAIGAITKMFADFESSLDAMVKGGDDPGDGSKPYGEVEYADPGYQSDKKKRYPIDTEKHVRAAWAYINKPKNAGKYSAEDLARVKGKIKAAAKKLGIEIEEDEKKASDAVLRKSLWDVGRMACIIQDLHWIEENVALEAVIEGDDSAMSGKLKPIVAELCAALAALVAEETAEVMGHDAGDDTAAAIGLAAIVESLSKGDALTDEQSAEIWALRKAAAGEDGSANQHSTTNTADNAEHAAPQAPKPADGANPEANSTVDTEHRAHLQRAHDALVKAGALCDTSMAMAADTGDLAKVTAERDGLVKMVGEQMQRLHARVEEIARTPIAPQLVKRPDHLSPVTKAQDGAGAAGTPALDSHEAVVAAYSALTPEQRTMAAIKTSHQKPLVIRGFSDGPMPQAGGAR